MTCMLPALLIMLMFVHQHLCGLSVMIQSSGVDTVSKSMPLLMRSRRNINEKRESLIHRTATTSYPCCGQALGEFGGSWSCMTFPTANVLIFFAIAKKIVIYSP